LAHQAGQPPIDEAVHDACREERLEHQRDQHQACHEDLEPRGAVGHLVVRIHGHEGLCGSVKRVDEALGEHDRCRDGLHQQDCDEPDSAVEQQRSTLVVGLGQRCEQRAHPTAAANFDRDLLHLVAVGPHTDHPPFVELDRSQRLVQARTGEGGSHNLGHRRDAAVLDAVAELPGGRLVEVGDEQLDVGVSVANHERGAQREGIVSGNDDGALDC